MRKRIFALVTFSVLLFVSVTAFAGYKHKEIFEGDNPFMGVDEVRDGDYYASGDEVQISGTITGDLYVAGGEVKIDGKIGGDVLVAGGRVEIGGQVADDIRAAGGEILINGQVGKNVSAAGGIVTLARSGRIGGSAMVFGQDIEIASSIARNLRVAGEHVEIASVIGGDVEAAGQRLELSNQTQIKGDLNYTSASEAMVDRKVQVVGDINYIPMTPSVDDVRSFNFVIPAIVSLLAILLIGLMFVWIYPNFCQQTVEVMQKKPLKVLLWGLLTVILTPVVVILLMVTVVGIPLALITLVGYLIMLYVVKIFVAIWVGNLILSRFKKKVAVGWSLVLGLVIYMVLSYIPAVGQFVMIAAVVFGAGMLVIAKKELIVKLKKKKLV